MSKIKKGEVRNPHGRKGKQDSADFSTAKLVKNNDGWGNLLTGKGMKGSDKSASDMFVNNIFITREDADALYRGSGLAKNIIDAPAEEMTRRWFTLDGEESKKVMKKLKRLKAKSKLTEWLKWGRLYGGSIVVMFIDDGRKLWEPVDEKNIRSVQALRVFDRWQIYHNEHVYAKGVESLLLDGKPRIFKVYPVLSGQSFDIHHTRVLFFEGEKLPDRLKVENYFFGDSSLHHVYESLRAFDSSLHSIESILSSFEQSTLSINGLTKMIAAGQENKVKNRIELLDLSRSVLRTMILDADSEQYEKKSSSIAGIAEAFDKFALNLSANTRIPQTLLFGRSPAGENATGESDFEQWYARISDEQEETLTPELETLVRYIYLSKEVMGKAPHFEIKQNPLKEPSEQEVVEMRNKQANTDALYIQNQVLDPVEVTRSRFVDKELYNVKPEMLLREQDDSETDEFETDEISQDDAEELEERFTR